VLDLRLLPSWTWRRIVWHIGNNVLERTLASRSTLKSEARGSAESFVSQTKLRTSCLTQLQSFQNMFLNIWHHRNLKKKQLIPKRTIT